MEKELEMVEKFNKSFKIPILEKPSLIDKKEYILRYSMTKLNENNNPIYREDGKVLKSKNYSKPDLKKILDN
jgi:hypothetical protein